MLPTKVYKKRQIIYNEDDPAKEMYILKSGTVKVVKSIKKNPVEIGILGKGAFLGEVALLRGENHSTTAIVEEDAELAVLNKEAMDAQFEEIPNWIKTLIYNLCDRLHDSIVKLSTAEKSEPEKKEKKEKTSDDKEAEAQKT